MDGESNTKAGIFFATLIVLAFIGVYLWDIVTSEPPSHRNITIIEGTVIDGPVSGYSRDRSLTYRVRLSNGLVVDARGIKAVNPSYRGPVELARSKGDWTGRYVYEIKGPKDRADDA